MKAQILLILLTVTSIAANSQTGGWEKYGNKPVIDSALGAVYDACVVKSNKGIYQMYFSWYGGWGIALSESSDGINWASPLVCLKPEGWDINRDHYNRPCVIVKDGVYHIWYSHEDAVRAVIEYATSADGKSWTRKSNKPVLTAKLPWEKTAVQYPHVIWDEQTKIFKMWYSAGEQAEPDAIGYATSSDGVNWKKYKNNPVFTANKQNHWERAKVAACQVIRRDSGYLMFYTGYSDPDHARIGMARSKDGITGWERNPANPVIQPDASGWDSYAVYKPCAVPDPANNRWLLYYDGRRGWNNRIGLAIHQGMDMGF